MRHLSRTNMPILLENKWCRGGELNSLRRPFQGRALPVSYPGTGAVKDSTGAMQGCQLRNGVAKNPKQIDTACRQSKIKVRMQKIQKYRGNTITIFLTC